MTRQTPRFFICAGLSALLVILLLGTVPNASAQMAIRYDVTWTTLDLAGGPFPMPLAFDPTNALGDSIEGFGFVDSTVIVTLSSQRPGTPGPPSLGEVCATDMPPPKSPGEIKGKGGVVGCLDPLPTVDPDLLDGSPFMVDSFFDVFFDITFTDVDARPGRDYAGMPDGASLVFQDNGPLQASVNYPASFSATADMWGLAPPAEASPYFVPALIEIPLGGDINGNGEFDKIKITLWTSSIGDVGRVFLPGAGNSIDVVFTSGLVVEGVVVDESTDPPFTLGFYSAPGQPDLTSFGGPGTWNALLANGVVPVELLAFTVE